MILLPSRSDFVYMAPPFLAYYGVTTRNRTLLEEAYNQIKLYRNYLRDGNSSMWRHVLLGPSENDEGFWSTGMLKFAVHSCRRAMTVNHLITFFLIPKGNGWAAAGMLRVLATMRQSEYANTFKNEQKDLATWVQEIHTGVYKHLVSFILPVDVITSLWDSDIPLRVLYWYPRAFNRLFLISLNLSRHGSFLYSFISSTGQYQYFDKLRRSTTNSPGKFLRRVLHHPPRKHSVPRLPAPQSTHLPPLRRTLPQNAIQHQFYL